MLSDIIRNNGSVIILEHFQDKALKEVGKLTILDFNTQEEWEAHQREVGKLNILVRTYLE